MNIEFDTYAVLGLAVVARTQGRYAEAADSLIRLIQQDQKNYRLYLELAECYRRQGEKRRAQETLEGFQRLGVRSQAVTEMLERIKA